MNAKQKLRLGTRGSDLARTQSGTVAASLSEETGYEVELTIIKTSGDNNQTALFGSIGPQGVFVREIEQALVEGRIDFAVHSFKDLPTKSPAELVVAAVPRRVDPADLLLVRRSAPAGAKDQFIPLAKGARVGTASARRRVWLKHFRPDLNIEPLRGNVPTRLRKLLDGGYDAIVLAAAGVERLTAGHSLGDLGEIEILRLDPGKFVPAPAQGALAVQCRRDDTRVLEALETIDHAPSHTAVLAERDALARAEGGCDIAFGAYCVKRGGAHELLAMHERAGIVRSARVRGRDPEKLGATAWATLDAGGDES
ncbi:MAG TPA: hydroxymethylbilane synthase [Gammaproteobacteria bacterium]|nr:hydroxymethylbilane synthase [Gammaproteobacteria bacterium]